MLTKWIKPLFFLLLLNFAFSCNSKPDPILEEAFSVHKSSLQVAKEAREVIKQFPVKDQQIQKLETRLNNWSKNIVEVPGFEHEHDHSDPNHHHHHHGPSLDVTPEDMLLIQKEFLDSVRVIKQELLSYNQQDSIQ